MKKRISMFDISLGNDEVKAVSEVIRSGWLSQGPKVAAFEKKFAEFIGAKFAVAVNSCTAALHLCLAEIGVSSGDEVITTPMTFIATVNSIIYQKAKPVFVDIDPRTFNINPDKIMEKVGGKTKAIIPVHYAGEPAEMRTITEIAEDHNLFVVEDAAHAPGAIYHGKEVGNIGNFGCFSFYPNKNITTGEGGMITLNEEKRAERLRAMRSHGMTTTAYQRDKSYAWQYEVITLGYNYRMNEIQAAIGIEQLKKLDEITEKRRENVKTFINELGSIKSIIPQYVPDGINHVYYFCPVCIENEEVSRDYVLAKLREAGILAAVHYKPVYLFKYFVDLFGNQKGLCPIAEEKYEKLISIPCHQKLSTSDMKYIASVLRDIVEGKNSLS